MKRPAELQHHVVGHVDQRGDAALTGSFEPRAHPAWRRRRRVDPADHPSGEAAAAFGSRNAHGVLGRAPGGNLLDGRQGEGRAGERGRFARDAEDRKAVAAVRRQLEGEDLLIEIEQCAHIRAVLGFRRKR